CSARGTWPSTPPPAAPLAAGTPPGTVASQATAGGSPPGQVTHAAMRPIGTRSACQLATNAMLQGVRPQPFPSLAVLADVLAAQPAPELEGAAIEAAVLVCLH